MLQLKLVHLLILFGSLFFFLLLQNSLPVVAVRTAISPNIIKKTCKQVSAKDSTGDPTSYYTLCVESLQSVPQSAHADLQGLTLISSWLVRKNTKHTKLQVKALLHAARGNNGSYVECLVTCCQMYNFAMHYLKEVDNRVKAKDHHMAIYQMSMTVGVIEDCDYGLQEQVFTSPVAELSNHLVQLSCIAYDILDILIGV